MKRKVLASLFLMSAFAFSADAFELDQQEIYNENGITVTVKGAESGFMGDEIKMEIVNDSTDDIIVQYDNVCVNGFMINALGSDDVASSKKAIGDITLMNSEMKIIDEVAKIQFNVKVLGSDYHEIAKSDLVTITVPGMESYEQVYDDSGEVMVDNDTCKIVFKGIEDSIMGKEAMLFIQNKTDDIIIVQAGDTSVNGYMINALQYCEMLPHSYAIDGITYLSTYLEESYIDEIEEIECKFKATDESYTKLFESEPINIQVK